MKDVFCCSDNVQTLSKPHAPIEETLSSLPLWQMMEKEMLQTKVNLKRKKMRSVGKALQIWCSQLAIHLP